MSGAESRLNDVLASFGRLAIAVSGGVDSMTLAWVAGAAMGGRMAVYHAVSAAVPPEGTARVHAYAARAGWALHVIDAGELADPSYVANPANRCFFCKTSLYGTIRRHTEWPIASGANLDDLGDWRPGLRAAAEHGVRHPLIEAEVTKAEVRAIAVAHGLNDLSELPSSPCLSSRIETGLAVTRERLDLVRDAEALLRQRFAATTTLRCRLRPAGIEVQLEAEALEGLDDAERTALARSLGDLARSRSFAGLTTFKPYARGSAFLRGAGLGG